MILVKRALSTLPIYMMFVFEIRRSTAIRWEEPKELIVGVRTQPRTYHLKWVMVKRDKYMVWWCSINWQLECSSLTWNFPLIFLYKSFIACWLWEIEKILIIMILPFWKFFILIFFLSEILGCEVLRIQKSYPIF